MMFLNVDVIFFTACPTLSSLACPYVNHSECILLCFIRAILIYQSPSPPGVHVRGHALRSGQEPGGGGEGAAGPDPAKAQRLPL